MDQFLLLTFNLCCNGLNNFLAQATAIVEAVNRLALIIFSGQKLSNGQS